jgi:hypothetical protein
MKTAAKSKKPSPLDVSFRAKLVQSPSLGGWVYVVWPKSVQFFGTRGLVKVEVVRGCYVLLVVAVCGAVMTRLLSGDGRPRPAGCRSGRAG